MVGQHVSEWWVNMIRNLQFILLFTITAPSWGLRSMTFSMFSFLAFLKISKGEKAYARAFLFYAILLYDLFNDLLFILFIYLSVAYKINLFI